MNVVPNSTKAEEVPLPAGATVCVAAFQRAAGGATPAPQADIWKASNTYAVQADGSLAASLTDAGGNPAAGSAPDMELHSGTYDFYAYSPALKTEADKYTVKGVSHYTDFMGALLSGRAVSRSTARVDLKFEHKCSKVRFNVVTAADMVNSSLEADSAVLYKMAVSPARDFTLGGDLLPTLGGDADTCLLKRVEAADNNKSTSVWDIVLPKSGSSFDADFYLKVSGIRYLLKARDIPAMSFGKGTQYIFNAVVRKGSVSLVLNVAAWDAVPENVNAGEGGGAGSGSWEEGGGNAGGGSGANHGIEIGRWDNVDWSGSLGGNPDPVTGALAVGSWIPVQVPVEAGGASVADIDSWVRKTLAAQAGSNHGGAVDGWGENGFETSIGSGGALRANCGIVGAGAAVSFDVEDRIMQASAAGLAINWAKGADYTPLLVWQDVAGLVTEVAYDAANGCVTVATDAAKGASGGNAVVGLFPAGTVDPSGGTCIWSWHVWVTDYEPDGTQEYGVAQNSFADVPGGQVHRYGQKYEDVNGQKVIMDRNLGATKAYYKAPELNDLEAAGGFGLQYQWGRKDPFPRADGSTINASSGSANTMALYSFSGTKLDTEKSDASGTGVRCIKIATALSGGNNALDYSVKNPLAFIYNTTTPFDWYAFSSVNQDNSLWSDGAQKSVYDPCPEGWRVALNGTWDDFTRLGPTTGTFLYWRQGSQSEVSGYYVANGRLYIPAGISTPLAWYPSEGYRNQADGMLKFVGSQGMVWASSALSFNGQHLSFNPTSLNPNSATRRSMGFSVRCIQE